MLLGAIADDLTGASDLALMLSREGMRTIQTIGAPPADFDLVGVDAVVIALKTRTHSSGDAVVMSLEALAWLKAAGARQIIFKYCSTFDSTSEGNIGPVTDALFAELGTDLTIVCPAFPDNNRTVYKGHLFVGDLLLSDSPMQHHPLTPMKDACLVRLMAEQSDFKVGLITYDVVARGPQEIRKAFSLARRRGDQILVIDAICDKDLRAIGEAAADFPLLTGASGIAIGLPENFRRAGMLPGKRETERFSVPNGRASILAGSCSPATRGQIRYAVEAGLPAFKLDPLCIADGSTTLDEVLDWAMSQRQAVPVIYSSAEPQDVLAAQTSLGHTRAGKVIEQFLARMAIRLRESGVRRLIVAGGETSGAVVGALAPAALLIGPEIDPGVPWTLTLCAQEPMALALKSGNFGTPDFFIKALDILK